VVAKFVDATNTGDSAGFFDLLTDDVSMSDDGSDRNVQDWVDSEIFSSNARMNVEAVSDGGRALVTDYTGVVRSGGRPRATSPSVNKTLVMFGTVGAFLSGRQPPGSRCAVCTGLVPCPRPLLNE
jgi:hypothetical protein